MMGVWLLVACASLAEQCGEPPNRAAPFPHLTCVPLCTCRLRHWPVLC